MAHVLKNHFATFYQAERTPTEPPKGTYTFVAQCGMSGVILGPPNYHDYQNQLRKLHAERFSRMPFDVFKSRVKIVKDEAVVKKWVEDQSFKTEYTCLNVPEPLKLRDAGGSRETFPRHAQGNHHQAGRRRSWLPACRAGTCAAADCSASSAPNGNSQKHFPLHVATALSKQFASHGLQFFKVNKTVIHVSVARPQFLDLETTPVSENIKRIVEFINATPKCTRRKMVESLAPPPPKPAVIEVKPDEPKAAATDVPTAEQTALIADLHWLIHQGHVLEFADGHMETAKKPLPRPPKPEKKPEGGKPAAEAEIVSADEAAPQPEAVAISMPDDPAPAEPAAVATPVSPEAVPAENNPTATPPAEEAPSPS